MFASDVHALASDFTMRVRVNEKSNAHFAWYFFRSVMFQAQIARELRGSSVSNIFPPQVQQMFVVDCSLEKQNSLAREIEDEIAGIRKAKRRVLVMQGEIHDLIQATSRKQPRTK
jgi:restriction endonuclease S subunit